MDEEPQKPERRSQSLTFKIPGLGEVHIRGMSLMVSLTFTISCVTAALLYEHQAHQSQAETALTRALTSVASAQRMTACIVSLPQNQREAQFANLNSFCARMADLNITDSHIPDGGKR